MDHHQRPIQTGAMLNQICRTSPGAISDYSKAIELDQKNSTAYYNRGFAKFDLQDYKGAISDYSKTIELDPQNVTAYHNRGSAKSNLQDYQVPFQIIQKSSNLTPNMLQLIQTEV